jgi:hypothetical protein
MWVWFTSLKSNYFLNVAVPAVVLFVGVLGHLVLEEIRATAAVHDFRRHVSLLRSKYYVFAMFFGGAAMTSIMFHGPVVARFALSRAAMDEFVAGVLENPDAIRPAPVRVGSYVLDAAPRLRSDGSLMFHLPEDRNTGFTYSTMPIIGYPGGNPGVSGKLGGGWYWFHDE